jgi:hypothetical protein
VPGLKSRASDLWKAIMAYYLSVGKCGCQTPLSPNDYGGGIVGILGVLLTLALKPSFLLASLLYARFDVHHKFTGARDCKNYFVISKSKFWNLAV